MSTFLHTFDPNQKPDLKHLTTFDKFISEFLKFGSSVYPRAEDDKQHLKMELKEGVSINNDRPIENFIQPVPDDATCYHNGYLRYLLAAWKNDCGIEVGPWHIWNIILHQICQIVKDDSEKFRKMFTKSDEKITIRFYDGAMFDIYKFINAIKEQVPVDIDGFVPKFDNQPENYVESMYGLFADMVQDHYACMIMSCSIPKIRILGTQDDWIKLVHTVTHVQEVFNANRTHLKYLDRVFQVVKEMSERLTDPSYWSYFFFVERCGSGSQEEVKGHVTKLLRKKHTILANELPSMICRYPFKFMQNSVDQKDYCFVAGVMFSKLDTDGILVPNYHKNITHINLDLCRMAEQTLDDTRVLIQFMDRMDKYSGKYKKNYELKNSDYCEQMTDDSFNCEDVCQPMSYEEYIKKRSCFNYRPKGEMELIHKKDYKKYCKQRMIHNERVKISSGDTDAYVNLVNKDRVERLKTKYYFWYNVKGITELDRKLVLNVSIGDWKKGMVMQSDDVAFIRQNSKVIFDYICNNRINIFVEKLFLMYNPEVLRLLVEHVFMFVPKLTLANFNNGCYSSLDPIVTDELFSHVGQLIMFKLAVMIFNSDVNAEAKHEMMLALKPFITTELIEIFEKMAKNRVSREVSSMKRFINAERTLQSCYNANFSEMNSTSIGFINDIQLYNFICSTVGIVTDLSKSMIYQVITNEFKIHNIVSNISEESIRVLAIKQQIIVTINDVLYKKNKVYVYGIGSWITLVEGSVDKFRCHIPASFKNVDMITDNMITELNDALKELDSFVTIERSIVTK
jgi:hypothetical protein